MTQLIINNLQLALIMAIAVISVLAVSLEDGRTRLIISFFLILLVSAFSLLLFSGVFVLMLAVLLLPVYIMTYYFYPQIPKDLPAGLRPWELGGAAIAVIGLGYWFYNSSAPVVAGWEPVENITIMNFIDIAREYFTNYYILIVMFMGAIFVTLVWFILMLDKRRP